MSVTIDFKQATDLLAMFGGEPTEITLMNGPGHSGDGLYAVFNADPEGAVFLGQTDEEATPDHRHEEPQETLSTDETCRLVGVKSDGTEVDLGVASVPPMMKAKDIVRSYFGDAGEGNDMSDGAMALQCCRELLDYMRRANAVAPVPGKKEPPHA